MGCTNTVKGQSSIVNFREKKQKAKKNPSKVI